MSASHSSSNERLCLTCGRPTSEHVGFTCPPADDLDDLRQRLEGVAKDYMVETHSWDWDTSRMHLTISDAAGHPVATLHIEKTQ